MRTVAPWIVPRSSATGSPIAVSSASRPRAASSSATTASSSLIAQPAWKRCRGLRGGPPRRTCPAAMDRCSPPARTETAMPGTPVSRTTRPRKASTPLAISARVTLTGLPFRGISLIGSQLLRAAFRCGGRLFERSAQAGAAAVSGRFDENRRDRLSAGAATMPPTEEARAADVSRLFRAEVLEARRAKAGAIVLVSPVSCRLLGAVGVAAAAALVAFLALGTYTRHVTLAGQLVPERGVIAVLAPQP